MWGLNAEQIATVIVGFATALTLILGGKKAKDQVRAAPARGEVTEVAGALIDGRAAREIVDAVSGLREALDDNTAAVGDAAQKIVEADRSLHALAIELARSGRR
ncbi:hypothetical protein Rsph17029_0626 [Rhodobacter sphaeroides ATCC 17029]|jgi:hypothetical protein|nr:hypothetical protein Rsph17029_0626 [Cereibacter sphaeroides ATCC 17029]